MEFRKIIKSDCRRFALSNLKNGGALSLNLVNKVDFSKGNFYILWPSNKNLIEGVSLERSCGVKITSKAIALFSLLERGHLLQNSIICIEDALIAPEDINLIDRRFGILKFEKDILLVSNLEGDDLTVDLLKKVSFCFQTIGYVFSKEFINLVQDDGKIIRNLKTIIFGVYDDETYLLWVNDAQ